jgi:hypothetical protein
MSYRTRINEVQIFGNNEYYQEWIDFIRSEGIKDDEDGVYDGYIENLQGMFDTIDIITRGLINDRHNQVVAGELTWEGKPCRELTDLSESMWLNDKTPLLMYNMQMIENAYCFLPYQLFKAVEDIIEQCEHDEPRAVRLGYRYYRLKDGTKIHVYAG